MKTVLIIIAVLGTLGVGALGVFVFVVQNVEQPRYETLIQDGPFELRDYPTAIVAEVERGGARREALSAGFGPLARYIFAKDREGERISMTAPVTQTAASPRDWSVRFFIPSGYALAQLPTPGDGSGVSLVELPPRRVAAIRFDGRTTDERIAEREAELRTWMATRGVEAASPPLYAYYNDPLTPGFLRRNEVMIEVAASDPAADPP